MSKWEEEFEDIKGVIRIRKSKNRKTQLQKEKVGNSPTEKQQKLALVVISMQ